MYLGLRRLVSWGSGHQRVGRRTIAVERDRGSSEGKRRVLVHDILGLSVSLDVT